MVFLENGRMLLPTGLSYGVDGQTGVREIDFLGKVYNEYVWDGGQHHDMTQLPNGNYVVLSNTPGGASAMDYMAVSYTHLDVYKRQLPACIGAAMLRCSPTLTDLLASHQGSWIGRGLTAALFGLSLIHI